MIPMTPWVKRLLLANVVMFLIAQPNSAPYQLLALKPYELINVLVQPHTLFTYMFLHAGLGHLFFNMIGLYFFGPRLEERLGGRGFLALYFGSGITGGLLHVVTSLMMTPAAVVGASGAVYGVLLGFALYWPRERIYLWMILPVEAWLLATLLVVGSLYSGIAGTNSGTAHFAHLGGLVFAAAYLKWRAWKVGSGKREFRRKLETPPAGGSSERAAERRWRAIELESLHELNREEVVALLSRVESTGIASLSADERRFLDRMARSTGVL